MKHPRTSDRVLVTLAALVTAVCLVTVGYASAHEGPSVSFAPSAKQQVATFVQ